MLTNIDTYNGFCSHIVVSRETFEKLSIFCKTLIKWQNSINLISKSSIKNIWERHILDSAQLYKHIKDINGNILDFGTLTKEGLNKIRPNLTLRIFTRKVTENLTGRIESIQHPYLQRLLL